MDQLNQRKGTMGGWGEEQKNKSSGGERKFKAGVEGGDGKDGKDWMKELSKKSRSGRGVLL
jgi:hypothetical protein